MGVGQRYVRVPLAIHPLGDTKCRTRPCVVVRDIQLLSGLHLGPGLSWWAILLAGKFLEFCLCPRKTNQMEASR